jgi:hypothetical protein
LPLNIWIWMGNERKIKIENKKNRNCCAWAQSPSARPNSWIHPRGPTRSSARADSWAPRGSLLCSRARLLVLFLRRHMGLAGQALPRASPVSFCHQSLACGPHRAVSWPPRVELVFLLRSVRTDLSRLCKPPRANRGHVDQARSRRINGFVRVLSAHLTTSRSSTRSTTDLISRAAAATEPAVAEARNRRCRPDLSYWWSFASTPWWYP